MSTSQSYGVSKAECDLIDFEINPTGTGYDSLKKNSNNVAVCRFIPEEQRYLLGIKSKYLQENVRLLLNSQTFLGDECPYDGVAE